MSDNITNQLISKIQSSPPNAPTIQPSINSNKIITKGGKRIKKSKIRKKTLSGGNTTVGVNNIPNTVVSSGIKDMYQQVNQARLTNLVQSRTDQISTYGGRRRKRRITRKRRKSRRRSI